MKYICKRCGKEFEAKHKTAVCQNCHTAVCVICGKEFELQWPWTQLTCSVRCRNEYIKQSGISKKRTQKANDTLKQKYGVFNASELQQFHRVCKYCGKEFDTTNARQEYCSGPHYGKCPVCGKQVLIKDLTAGPKACSEKCKQVLIQKTNIQKYGEAVSVNSEYAKKKAKQTCLEKYGVDHYSKTDEYRQKFEKTMLERYGSINPLSVDSIRKKKEQTCIKKYGTPSYFGSNVSVARLIKSPKDFLEYKKFISDPVSYCDMFDTKPTIHQLENKLGVTDTTIYNVLNKFNCRDKVIFSGSSIEHDVMEFLIQLISNITIQHNNKSIISPQELDLYLPEYNLAIECNPTVTHNSSLPDPWGQAPKPYKYHYNKSIGARNKGVFLFHIFGYEWTHKKEIILSMLANLVGCSKDRVYGRDTYVCEISNKDCVEFLDTNHRQGSLSAKIRLGLRRKSNDELVSVMTFGKVRSTMGTNDVDKGKDVYELSRFCSKLNTSVVGGASKLFSYFLKNYQFDKIISFSDVAHTAGGLYKKLRFKNVVESEPNYVWVNSLDDSALNRVNCQKKNLPKLFNEPDLDIENKTEREIMEDHGFVRVYDSGTIRWEYVR